MGQQAWRQLLAGLRCLWPCVRAQCCQILDSSKHQVRGIHEGRHRCGLQAVSWVDVWETCSSISCKQHEIAKAILLTEIGIFSASVQSRLQQAAGEGFFVVSDTVTDHIAHVSVRIDVSAPQAAKEALPANTANADNAAICPQ